MVNLHEMQTFMSRAELLSLAWHTGRTRAGDHDWGYMLALHDMQNLQTLCEAGSYEEKHLNCDYS